VSTIRLVTYNIRHGKGIDGAISLGRIAQTLKNINADIAALQEVDKHLPRSFLKNQAKAFARLTSMHYAFAPNIRFFKFFFSFGNAVLSKYPIAQSGNLLLPGQKERRGLQHCTILLPGGRKIYLFNTHLGLSTQERRIQIEALVKKIDRVPYPVLLAGDFNCAPGDNELILLSQSLEYAADYPVNTFPSHGAHFPIDHIYVSRHWLVTDVFTYPSTASDHLPLVCNLQLKPNML
jgi:endonuclease/exonuclease/phosphatase family metal-dependent hydrolase